MPLEQYAVLARKQSWPRRAVRLFGAAGALRESLQAPLPPADHTEYYDREVEHLQSSLGEDGFTTAWAEGSAMSAERAVAYALGEERD
jgi:hypothetical protein